MKTVVVTGAAGFAGCNLTEKLIEKGYTVYAVLRPGSEHNKRLEPLTGSGRLNRIELDINNIARLPEYIVPDTADTFFHLAWTGGRDDFNAQYKNIDDTVKALEAASVLKCRRFICTGSQAEYGITGRIQTEDLSPAPFSAYGAAKTAAMYLTKRRAEQLGLEWIWGRIFSLYGKYEPEHTLVRYVSDSLKNGEDVHVTAALQNWDYLDAGDCAEGLIALGERGKSGEIYNIASGEHRPLREFIEMLAKKNLTDPATSEDADPRSKPQIHYDKTAEAIVSLQPSIDKIKRDTGWSPAVSF